MSPEDAVVRAGRALPTRAEIRQLVDELDPAVLPLAFDIAGHDLRAQTNLALAAALAGVSLPTEALVALAPDVLRWEQLALLLGRNPAAAPAMLDALVDAPWAPIEHRACAVALRLYDTDPSEVPIARGELRQMLRMELRSLWHDELILASARRLRERDPHIAALYERATAKMPELHPEAIALPGRFAAEVAAADLEVLPERIERAAPAAESPKVGRNEPCPCGSGKKFKKCCGRPGAAPPQPPEDDRERLRPDLLLPPEALGGLPAALLARLPFDEVATAALRPAILALAQAFHVPGLERALHAWARRGIDDDDAFDRLLADGLFILIANARWSSRPTIEALTDELRTAEHRAFVQGLLATLAEGPELDTLEAQARASLDQPPGHVMDLAASLLPARPALAIFLLRGFALDAHPEDGRAAASYVALARDRLGAAPDDPLPAILRMLDRDDARAEARDAEVARERRARAALEDELAELRAAMRRTRAHSEELEAELAAGREALAKLEADDADEGAPAVDPEELRRLRTKVRELKGRIEEGKHERSALRDRLQEAERTSPAAGEGNASDASPPEAEDADEPSGADALEPTRLRVPEWSGRARKSLATLPAAIAQQSIVIAGQLAVGDPLARRGAKKLEGFEHLRRARVGIHYRLLYVLHDETLEVVDVLARENLDSHLGRLRKTIG